MSHPFVYVQLQTQGYDKAKDFYKRLFNWKMEDAPSGNSPYTELIVEGGAGGGMMKHPVPNAPSYWLPYVGVPDVNRATEQAEKLGARVLQKPTEAPGKGVYSIISDPTGAVLGLWQAAAPLG